MGERRGSASKRGERKKARRLLLLRFTKLKKRGCEGGRGGREIETLRRRGDTGSYKFTSPFLMGPAGKCLTGKKGKEKDIRDGEEMEGCGGLQCR